MRNLISTISKALESKEARIALANAMVLEIQRSFELSSFGFIPPKTKKEINRQKRLEKKLKDILDHQTQAPSDVHKEISNHPWDFV